MAELFTLSGYIFAVIIAILYEYQRISQLIRKPKNNVHFYVARDKSGELCLYLGKPVRGNDKFMIISTRFLGNRIKDYGLNPSNYDNLKWEDEPVEVFISMED